MHTPDTTTRRTGHSATALTALILASLAMVVSMVVSILGITISGAGAQTIDPAVPSPTVSSGDSAQLAAMVNDYRIANGLNPLVIDAAFSAASEAHAQVLSSLNPTPPAPPGYSFWCPEASASSFYHDSAANQLASAPAGSVAYGENIAFRCSTSFATHPDDIMVGWKNSPGHDTNMLNPNWTHIASVAVRWNNTTIAVHRFASVPGTTPPAVSSVASPAAAVAVAPEPTAAPAVAPVPTVTAETTTATDTAATDTAATAADTTSTSDSTAATTTTESADTTAITTAATDTTAAATPGSAANGAPQLAFTGTNLNLAFVGVALIVVGLGILWLPSVRRFSDHD